MKENKKLVNDLIDLFKSLNLDLYGITSFKRLLKYKAYFTNRDLKFINPFETNIESIKDEKIREEENSLFLEKYKDKFIISIAFPYLTNKTKDILKEKINNKRESKDLSIYTYSKDYHFIIKFFLDKIINFIKENGYFCEAYSDNNMLLERLIAFDSNIGFIGRNNMIINEKYGSFIYLSEIVTDLDLSFLIKEDECNMESNFESNNENEIESKRDTYCKECNNCIKACPVSILGGKYSNTNKCLSFLTQEKNLESSILNKFNGRIFACDTCQVVCPYNDLDKIKLSELKEFEPLQSLINIKDEKIAYLTKKEFLEIKISALSWRGKTLLQRNALVKMVDEGKEIDFSKINSMNLKEEIEKYIKFKERICR